MGSVKVADVKVQVYLSTQGSSQQDEYQDQGRKNYTRLHQLWKWDELIDWNKPGL